MDLRHSSNDAELESTRKLLSELRNLTPTERLELIRSHVK